MAKLLPVLTVFTCLFMVSSCKQLTSQEATSSEGRDFSIEAMNAIPVGTPQEEVLQQFGEPTEKSAMEGGIDLWIYIFVEVTARGYSDNTAKVEKQRVKSGSVFVKDGKVVKVTATEEITGGQ